MMKIFPQLNNKVMMFSSMGLELGLSVVVGLVLGSWLDGLFATDPWLLLVFGISGVIAGYRSLFRILKKVHKASSEPDDQGS